MVLAIERQVKGFEMPGTGIIDFATHARAIAKTGIYDFQVHHDHILAPVVLRHWDIENLTGLSDEAERSRDELVKFIGRVGKAGKRQVERRQRLAERDAELAPA
jgi:acyl-[acyl-carrier-protein] desaturase